MSLELIAIYQAIVYAISEKFDKIVIFTDSRSAIQHLARCVSGCRGASVAYDILQQLCHFNNEEGRLILQWVPAHIGLRGNEEADHLSKLAIEMENETPYTPDYWEYCSKFQQSCYDKWLNYFNEKSNVKGIWYKTIQNELPRVPWFEDAGLGRNYVKLALRLRSGHYPSAKFAFLMGKVASPNCELCNKVEDIQHLLMECARNNNERESLIRKYELNKLDVGLVQNILANPKTKIAKGLCELVRVT